MTSLRRIAALAVITLAVAGTASAQIPDKFTNLQVLPKDISRAQLTQIMRSFTGALGVRCSHCHVGASPANLDGYDFAADTKEPKRVARAMMRMTQEINTRLLPQTGRSPVMEVRCVTCHHGLPRPEALTDVLKATVKKDGVDAAIAQYRELREKHYGRGAYDFGAPTLNQLAESLAESNVEGAIAIQKLNVEANPNIASSHSLLGRLYTTKGDRPAAIAQYERAAALDPADESYRKRLEELKRPEASPKPN
jgi:tetratricopeptide (TPR) repeat protein